MKKGIDENIASYVVTKNQIIYYTPIDNTRKDRMQLVFARKRTKAFDRKFIDILKPMVKSLVPNRYYIQENRLRAINRYIIGKDKELTITKPRYKKQRMRTAIRGS